MSGNSQKEKRRNELEILLSIFDQSSKTKDQHILNVKETDFPDKFRPMIRRLQRATEELNVRKTMDIEDEVLEELENKERTIAEKEQIIKEKDKTIEEKNKIIEELRKKIKEK